MRRGRGNVGLISPRGEKSRAGIAAVFDIIDGRLGIGDFIDPGVVDTQSNERHAERDEEEGEPCSLWLVTSHEWRVTEMLKG